MDRFIVFEGIDGSGKTSFMDKFLPHYIWSRDIKQHTICQDPGGTFLGERLRNMLPYIDDASRRLEVFLLARKYLKEDIVLPRLERGDVVFCDRWFPSTAVYQEMCEGLPIQDRTDESLPQAVFYLKVDPEIAHERKQEDAIDKLRRLARYYDEYFSYKPHILIDANQPLRRMSEQIMEELDKVLFPAGRK